MRIRVTLESSNMHLLLEFRHSISNRIAQNFAEPEPFCQGGFTCSHRI